MCQCDLCQARALGVHPWALYWGLDSIEARLLAQYPDKPIYWYEDMARIERAYPLIEPRGAQPEPVSRAAA